MKVWKIASRWSNDGNSNSVLDLFKKHKIAFVYNENIKVNEVEIGDLLAISDGNKIVSIGKVLNAAMPIDKFNIPELNNYNDDECTVGFKMEYMNLSESDIIHYNHMGRFHGLPHDVQKHITRLWNNQLWIKKIKTYLEYDN